MIHKFLNWLKIDLKKLNRTNKESNEIVIKINLNDFVFWNWFMIWTMGFFYTFGKESFVTYGHFWKEVLYLVIYYVAWPYVLGHQGFRLPF